jgi:hypothetical protein
MLRSDEMFCEVLEILRYASRQESLKLSATFALPSLAQVGVTLLRVSR